MLKTISSVATGLTHKGVLNKYEYTNNKKRYCK